METGKIKLLFFLLVSVAYPPEACCGTADDCENPTAFITQEAIREVLFKKCSLQFVNPDGIRNEMSVCLGITHFQDFKEDSIAGCHFEGTADIYNVEDRVRKIRETENRTEFMIDWKELQKSHVRIEGAFTTKLLQDTAIPEYKEKLVEVWNGKCFNETFDTGLKILHDQGSARLKLPRDPWFEGRCAFWAYFSCCVNREIQLMQEECYGRYIAKFVRQGNVDMSGPL